MLPDETVDPVEGRTVAACLRGAEAVGGGEARRVVIAGMAAAISTAPTSAALSCWPRFISTPAREAERRGTPRWPSA